MGPKNQEDSENNFYAIFRGLGGAKEDVLCAM